MACKIVKTKDYTAIQCSNIGEFEYLENGIYDPDQPPLEPYSRFECKHENTYEKKGYLYCSDCNYYYNDDLLRWEERKF